MIVGIYIMDYKGYGVNVAYVTIRIGGGTKTNLSGHSVPGLRFKFKIS
jgi:hypothetical protein